MKYRINYPWVVVGLLWFVALLNYMDRQMLSTMKPSMMVDIVELNTAANFGRLMAVFLWIYALMSPISGIIADRLNRKWVIVGSLFVWSAVTLLMGYATTFNQLYSLRAVMGLSEAFYVPAGLSLIADYHQGRNRSLAVGIHITGIYLGQALGGFGATIAGSFSWQMTFHLFGLIGIVYSIVLILFLKEKKAYLLVPDSSHSFARTFFTIFKGVGVLLGNMSFWVILFYFSAPSLPGWATKNWLPTLFSNSLHINMEQAGPLSTITIAHSALIGVLVGGIVSDRWVLHNLRGRIFTSAIGLSLTIPAVLLLGFGESFLTILGGSICFGFGFGIFDVNSMPILCQFVPPRYRATGYGLMNLAGISAGAVITTFLGKSADSGNLSRDIAFLAFFVLAALILQLLFLHPRTANKTE
ncbi:MAG: MFS transporter [Bacteroidia bacterium]|nr:MFS transporter [Bacteroidia bacterium]